MDGHFGMVIESNFFNEVSDLVGIPLRNGRYLFPLKGDKMRIDFKFYYICQFPYMTALQLSFPRLLLLNYKNIFTFR